MSRLHHSLVAAAVFVSTVLLAAGPTPQPRRPIVERKIQLKDHTKTIYLVTPEHARHPDVLVLYASGDGGWFGRAVDMFREIGDSGYAAVGIGVHDYPPRAKELDADALRQRLTDDYRQIVIEGRAALGMPASGDGTHGKVILTGWSQGAAYALLAASDDRFAHDVGGIAGVITWGLPDAKETGIRASAASGTDGTTATDGAGKREQREHWDPYAALMALASTPRALIQSTGDHFTPAAESRRLTGPDTSTFTLHTIDARNHRFDEGMAAFRQSLEQELDRMAAGATQRQASRREQLP
jgi:dienelactone hydrolase